MPRYIDADASIEKVEKLFCQNCTPPKSTYCNSCRAKDIILFIQGLPTANVQEVKHGRWLISSDGYYPYCSECKAEPENGKMTKWCAECGAKMDGGDAD